VCVSDLRRCNGGDEEEVCRRSADVATEVIAPMDPGKRIAEPRDNDGDAEKLAASVDEYKRGVPPYNTHARFRIILRAPRKGVH